MTWFEQLFGFREGGYAATRARFAVTGAELRSLANGRRFGIGQFARPSLGELREHGRRYSDRGTLEVRHVVIGDVLELHAREPGATFQVASQLNCLEFAGPNEVPEDGVTQYDDDPTQGPACALAAAAATVYRNYFVPVPGAAAPGQTRDRQLNNLSDLQALLGADGALVTVTNGYTFSDAERLARLNARLAQSDRDALMAALRIGVQRGVEVTFARRFEPPPRPVYVNQAFCSALSCGYTGGGKELWAPLASLVLDAAYEATLWAALLSEPAADQRPNRVWLTFLGGGAFGNDKRWIAAAIRRALDHFADRPLDVRIAHYGAIDETMRALIGA